MAEEMVMENETTASMSNLLRRRAAEGYQLVPGYCVVVRNGQYGPDSYEVSLVLQRTPPKVRESEPKKVKQPGHRKSLLPCPFCGGDAKTIFGFVGCEPCAVVRRDAASWNRREGLE